MFSLLKDLLDSFHFRSVCVEMVVMSLVTVYNSDALELVIVIVQPSAAPNHPTMFLGSRRHVNRY